MCDRAPLHSRLTDEQGLRLWKAKVAGSTLASNMAEKRLQDEGAWPWLIEKFEREAALRRRLHDADKLLATDTAEACRAAFEAIRPILPGGSDAIRRMQDALTDLADGIPNDLFELPRGPGSLKAGVERSQFEGVVAGLIEVMRGELGSLITVFRSTNPNVVEALKLAEKRADQLGCRTTLKSIYDRILRREREKFKHLFSGSPISECDMRRLGATRMTAITLIRSAQRNNKRIRRKEEQIVRPKDLEARVRERQLEWCVEKARAALSPDRKPIVRRK